jgi:hypothetical protein
MKILINLDAPPSAVNPLTLNMPEDPELTARGFFDVLVQQEGSLTNDVFIPVAKIASVVIERGTK